MKLFTIGFTKKSAQQFFGLLVDNGVKTVFDVRLNNNSQLAGFTKGTDLPYFLDKIGGISYRHFVQAAPTKDLLQRWQKNEIKWPIYEKEYLDMLNKRKIIEKIDKTELDHGCLLCSEPTVENCHRRLLAEYLKEKIPDLEIIHL